MRKIDVGSYRLGVKRKWWFGYKVYTVKDHNHMTYIMREELKNLLNIRPKLNLSLVDGSQISIPDIESRQWKLYPEYRTIEAKRAALKVRLEAKAAARATEPRQTEGRDEISSQDLPQTLQ